MRNLVTVEWIAQRDTAGLVVDSTSLDDAILRVSFDVYSRVGHDFGDSTAATETLDGIRSPTLQLAGRTQYPLRTLESISIDDFDIDVTADFLIQYRNRSIGNLVDKIRRKYAVWSGHQIDITGDWGWTDTPDDVKEAVFRLLVLDLTGTAYGKANAGNEIKRLKHPDGVEIEYNVASRTESENTESTGDAFTDEVIQRYRWRSSGGVV